MYYFYYLDRGQRNQINNPKEFISYYSKAYYMIGEKDKDGRLINEKGIRVPYASQSCYFIEENIERILKHGITCRKDIIHLLAWKMGGIDHKKSKEKKAYIYKEEGPGWSENHEKEKAVHWRSSVENTPRLIDSIISKIDEWKKLSFESNTDAESVLWDLKCDICKNRISKIGPVYLVTLLYFISQGKFPIYDQQAMKALEAIKLKNTPPSSRRIPELPDISSPKFWEIYNKYIKLLEELSEKHSGDRNEYQSNRNIDRALWVYGHVKF